MAYISGKMLSEGTLCVSMNKICKEMNKLWPIFKFLWYKDDADVTQLMTITHFLRTAELKMSQIFTLKMLFTEPSKIALNCIGVLW